MRINLSRHARLSLAVLVLLMILGLAGLALTRAGSQSATKTSSTDGKQMVRVLAGEFRMGTSAEQAAALKAQFGPQAAALSAEMPQTTVNLPEFYLDQTVVTNAEYKKFLDANPNHPVPYIEDSIAGTFNWNRETRTPPQGRELEPAVLVTWRDALDYCRWAGKRLPTEAEWEKAARGVDGRIWPWGNEPEPPKPTSAEATSGDMRSAAHLTLLPSPYGALDMVGYVLQWTSSLDKPYPYDAKDGREDPNATGMRITRGSGRLFSGAGTRVALRNRFDPNSASLGIGFRCAQ